MKRLKGTLTIGVFLACLSISSIAQITGMTSLTAENGKEYSILVEGPENSQIGILIIHDWFGVTDLTRESAKRFADKGARVVAVDLYNGRSAITHDDAKILQKSLNVDHAQQSIKVALQLLQANKRRIAVVGYSAGAKFALRAAAEHSNVIDATALIYGGGYDFLDEKLLVKAGPILAVYGSDDDWSHKSFIALRTQMDKLQKNIETYIYPNASHAFAQSLFNDGKNLDPLATQAMRHVLDGFLERNLFSTLIVK